MCHVQIPYKYADIVQICKHHTNMQVPYKYARAIQICTYHMAPAADFEATVPLVSLPFFDVVLIQPGPLLSPDGVFVLHYPVWKLRLERV